MDDLDALDAQSEASPGETPTVPETTSGAKSKGRGRSGGKSGGKGKVKHDACYICADKKLRNR